MGSALDNDDVLTEILLRLPAKSLMGFKSVCKKWLSLISSDYFSHQHTLCRRPKPQPSLILQHWGHSSYPHYFYWKPTLSMNGENVMIPYTLSVSPHYQILQACNGLLLLRGLDSNFNDVYRVYNPTTRQSTEINIPTCNTVAVMALAFDPSKSPYYKIVCIRCFSSKQSEVYLQAEVYDSERRRWKLSSEQFTSHRWFSGAQYWNNAIFWWQSYTDALFCFDIAKDEMKIFSTPQYHGEGDSYFQELDGKFYYLRLAFKHVLESGSSKLLVAVWELGGDGNSEWLFKNNAAFVSEGKGECVGLIGGAENLVVLIYHESGKMRAYSFLHERGEDVVDFTPPYHDQVYHHLKAFQFRETLALV